MPSTQIPFITYQGEADRDMVVIDGQPYYKSTGLNSGLRGTWFPFIMVCGSKLHHQFENPIKYPAELKHVMEEYFQTRLKEDDDLPHRDKASQPYYTIDFYLFNQSREFKYELKKANNQPIKTFSSGVIIKADTGIIAPDKIDIDFKKINDIFMRHTNDDASNDRISTRKDLINSMRLGGGIWEDKEIKAEVLALLSDEEREQVNSQIQRKDTPELVSDDPDAINDWLIRMDSKTLNELYDLNRIKEEPTFKKS